MEAFTSMPVDNKQFPRDLLKVLGLLLSFLIVSILMFCKRNLCCVRAYGGSLWVAFFSLGGYTARFRDFSVI